jgi:diguanylate cyclase (GGDEF)-like protein
MFGLRRFEHGSERGSALLAAVAGVGAALAVPAGIAATWPGRGLAVWTIPAFVALGFLAGRIRFGPSGQGRDRYSPGCLVVVLAGLVGGPAAGAAAGAAAAHRFGDRRADLYWLSEAALAGLAAGLVGLTGMPVPLRVVLALASVQLLTTAALAAVQRIRPRADSPAISKRMLLVLAIELAAATPLLVLLVESYVRGPALVLLTVAALLCVFWLVQRGRDGYQRELSSERERARRDELTGLLNRRGSEEALAQEHARVARGGLTTGLLLLDFDRFHWINQAYDLAGGDLVLRELSRRLVGELRAGDVVGRWGGEELIVLAPGIEPAAISVLAEKVRRIVRDTPVRVGDADVVVTCSVGATMLDGGVNAEVSLQRANRALKQAKELRDTARVDSAYERRDEGFSETQVDALTGLLNRQALASLVLPREAERACAGVQPLALLLVDLDDLKQLNDRFGHVVGDQVLAGVADAITGVVGREDLVFRTGGDEFAVLLPLGRESACERADAVLRAIGRRAFANERIAPSALARVTASIGVALLTEGTMDDADLAARALLTTAEDAALEAKKARNRCVVRVVGERRGGASEAA